MHRLDVTFFLASFRLTVVGGEISELKNCGTGKLAAENRGASASCVALPEAVEWWMAFWGR